MKKYFRFVLYSGAAIALLFCITWCFLAPYLSAHNKISVLTEFESYRSCLTGVAVGLVLGIAGAHDNKRIFICFAAVSFCIIALIFITSSSFSTAEFKYWKVRFISNSDWNEMALDLASLGKSSSQDNSLGVFIMQNQLGPNLSKLGKAGDHPFVHSQTGFSGTVYTNEFTYIKYLDPPRSWILFIGPEEYLKFLWPGWSVASVGQNAFFVVGQN